MVTLTVGQRLKTFTVKPFRWLLNAMTLVIGNPIISREMKVRMRFARAFWLQGAYLLFLISIVSLAYQFIVALQPLRHPADLQQRLQGFYYTLLYSLVAIVVLIAPALTASALSFERERRTLDLLLTTPLRPMQILVGKLLASYAFLLLLLVLSMPIVTVCIIMGGATVADLLATFGMVAFSTLHLCAFALYCSACNRSSGAATFWAYLGVAGMLMLTFPLTISEIALGVGGAIGGAIGGPMGMVSPQVVVPLASLHPFAAPVIKAMPTELFGVKIPCWLFCGAFSLLLTRFWLTAAAARLPAIYRGNPVGSIRRQALLLSVLAVLSFDAFLGTMPVMVGPPAPPAGARHDLTLGFLMAVGFDAAFIAFFVPWIATFGEHEGRPPANDGWFRPLRMFQPSASGALPFTLSWFAITCATGIALSVWRLKTQPFWTELLIGIGYSASVLTFFWSMGRFWSASVRQLTLARWLTLGTTVLLLVLPGFSKWSLVYPFVKLVDTFPPADALKDFTQQVSVHGSVVGVLTLLLFLLSHTLRGARIRR